MEDTDFLFNLYNLRSVVVFNVNRTTLLEERLMILVSETVKAKNVIACHRGIRREKGFQNINETVSECRGERERDMKTIPKEFLGAYE